MILEDKFLKKIEEIKENISKINDPLEMVRFLDEIQINTAKWCKQNCPEEVIFENGTEIEITISGRMQFLNSIQYCCRISKKGKCNASFFYSVFFPSLYK